MRSFRSLPLTCLTLAAGASDGCYYGSKLNSTPVPITQVGQVFRPQHALQAPGPQVEISLRFDQALTCRTGADTCTTADGRAIRMHQIRASLTTTSGAQIELVRFSMSVTRLVGKSVTTYQSDQLFLSALVPTDTGREISAVRLSSTDSITVLEIRWWSGESHDM